MERHMIRNHDVPQRFLPIIPISPNDRQKRFKVQGSYYYNPSSDVQNSSKALTWPLSNQDASEQRSPSWLEWLRRCAEISKLMREIKQNQRPINPLRAPVNTPNIQEPQFKDEDLVVVGYTAFICDKCLISHPLTLYWHRPSMEVVHTNHGCDTKILLKVQQQKRNNKEVMETLSNETPKLMFRVVKRWTKGVPLAQADEIQSIPEVLRCCILVDSKNWAFRAIQNRFTVLSDEELADFLNLSRCNTYACFRTAESNKTYYMHIAATASSKDHIDSNFAFGP